MGKKILITATDLHMTQFWTGHIEQFCKNGFDVDLVCSDVGDKVETLRKKIAHLDVKLTVVDLKRSPLSPHNIRGFFQLKKYLRHNQYDVIITNEPVMGVMTRLAAIHSRKKYKTKVVYFAHGFHFWEGSPKFNWLIFANIEKFLARYTDTVFTMNDEDYKFAVDKLNTRRILYIHGIGVDLSEFHKEQGVREKKRRELGVEDDTFVLYSTSELTDRKNLSLAVDIVSALKKDGYNVHFFNRGTGPLEGELNSYAEEQNISDCFTLLGYGRDVRDMCLAADAFLFTSKQEGLPVAVMEAMSCGLPCVVSDIRGVKDLISDGKGGYLCSIENCGEFVSRIEQLIDNKDDKLIADITSSNKKKLEPYSFENVNDFLVSFLKEITIQPVFAKLL